MLVLTRKLQQSIWIGPDIQVTILAIKGGKVRIGVDAPREVPICRKELEPWEGAEKGLAGVCGTTECDS